MIVSHRYGYVFVAVPKTASQAIRLALRPHLGPHDWEQCGLLERRRFPVPALAAIGHGHITCRELRPYLLPELWRRYRKFAFMRDPVERFRSLLRFWFGAAEGPPQSLDSWKRLLADTATRQHPLLRPQAHFLCDDNGNLMMDDIGRHENLAADFQRIVKAGSIPASALQSINRSPRPAEEVTFDDELLGMIAECYRDDFRLRDTQASLAGAA